MSEDIVRVTVIGVLGSPEEYVRYKWANDVVHQNKSANIQITSMPEGLLETMKKKEMGWADLAFESITHAIDASDVIVIPHPVNAPRGMSFIGWVMGYAWGLGIPVVYVAYDSEYIKGTIVGAKSIHAHLTSEEELREYDFKNIPHSAFKGELLS